MLSFPLPREDTARWQPSATRKSAPTRNWPCGRPESGLLSPENWEKVKVCSSSKKKKKTPPKDLQPKTKHSHRNNSRVCSHHRSFSEYVLSFRLYPACQKQRIAKTQPLPSGRSRSSAEARQYTGHRSEGGKEERTRERRTGTAAALATWYGGHVSQHLN